MFVSILYSYSHMQITVTKGATKEKVAEWINYSEDSVCCLLCAKSSRIRRLKPHQK